MSFGQKQMVEEGLRDTCGAGQSSKNPPCQREDNLTGGTRVRGGNVFFSYAIGVPPPAFEIAQPLRSIG